MKLLTMIHEEQPRPAIWLAETRLLDLSVAFNLAVSRQLIPQTGNFECRDMVSFIEREIRDQQPYTRLLWEAGRNGRLDEAIVPAGLTAFMNPLHGQRKNTFCVGRNYLDHVAEGDRARGEQTQLPEWPTFFTKPATAFTGPDHTVYIPEHVSDHIDYEVELGVVIGKGGRDIRPEDAMDHVFGYTIVNDISARDLQKRHGQWFKGKSLDASCPVGPWIVHKDDVPDPHALEISLLLNGEVRQKANTSEMIFKIPEIIASLSAGMTLEPGDLIATGTPAGVGFAMAPPQYLVQGDRMRCEIQSIGRLSNFFQSVDD
jgi:2-keto-4-pentenoate hydratase/2-oxohepta-3-ene-1,7-dioic acid hydratase in catechol pathway